MKLNTEQKMAVEHSGSHVLVLAGAGTGKTRTIIARAANLIKKGVDPKRILMLTFTRRAAKEMKSRLNQMLGEDTHGLMTGTFHHFCLYTMRRMPRVFAMEKSTVIDRNDQIQLMKSVRSGFVKKGQKFLKPNAVVDLYSFARNTNQSPELYLRKFTEHDDETIALLLEVFAEYDDRKRAHDYIDYDDILFLFAKKLHEDAAVSDRLKGFYDHILVDEMQDTNPLQWLILDGLRDPAQLFCVGDDAQSIYAFRGADFKNVHSFTTRVPGSTVLKLDKNYRSTQEILDISNWLLKKSTNKYNKALKAHRGKGIKPMIIDCESDLDEANWITADLIERHENGAIWKDHMVLTRTAAAVRALETSLIKKKIPYRFIGGTSFIQAAHVKDLFSLVRSASSPNDQIAWVRYLTLFPTIGDVRAGRIIADLSKEQNLESALKAISNSKSVSVDIKDRIVEGITLVMKNRDNPEKALQSAAEFLEPIIKDRYDKWIMRRKDYDLLIRLAKNYESLMSLIETFTLDPISTSEAERADVDDFVTVITVHSAKGAESPVCYLIQVQPRMYPHIRSIGNIDEEEEERRVLYVAMTRAQNELIITRDISRRYCFDYSDDSDSYYGTEGQKYFLENLPDRLSDQNTPGYRDDSLSYYDDPFLEPSDCEVMI